MIYKSNKTHNQQGFVNEKWKFFCAALALLYAGDVIAGNSFSSKNLRRSNSKTRVTSFNTGASLSGSSSRSSLKGIPMNVRELSRLLKENIVIHISEKINKMLIKEKLFCESQNKEDLYEEFLNYYGINMPGNGDAESKFRAFMKLGPVERAKSIKSARESDISEIEKLEKQRQKLISYIESDNIEDIENMINTTVSFEDIVNLMDNQNGRTPLWAAIRKNPRVERTGPSVFDIKVDKSPVKINLDIVELLLKNGADANSISLQTVLSRTTGVDVGIGIPMLMESTISEKDKLETIKLLLQYGADPMSKKKGWNSSLCAAIDDVNDGKIRYEICKMLLEKASDVVKLTGFRGRTPYMYADYKKDQKVMNLLKEYGADTYIDPEEDMSWQ